MPKIILLACSFQRNRIIMGSPKGLNLPELQSRYRIGEQHLSTQVSEFAPLIAAIGPCTLVPDPELFPVLVRSIVAQLISTAAAKTITARLVTKLKNRLTPANLAKLSLEEVRGCGLSGAKATALLQLAAHFQSNRNFARKIIEADDGAARAMLLPLRGIGPWTVDMVLIFCLGRLDILPVGDLGLRAGAQEVFRLEALPGPKQLTEIAESWRPFRSLATWYLWRSRGFVPQSGEE
jgi:DNA-3-methyladenine glycosylase II